MAVDRVETHFSPLWLWSMVALVCTRSLPEQARDKALVGQTDEGP